MTHRPRPQEQLVAAEAARGPLALDEQYAVVSVRHSRAQLTLRSPPEPARPRPRSSPGAVCHMARAGAAAGGGGSATRKLCAGRSRSADEQHAETLQPAPIVHLYPFFSCILRGV